MMFLFLCIYQVLRDVVETSEERVFLRRWYVVSFCLYMCAYLCVPVCVSLFVCPYVCLSASLLVC